MFVDTFAKRLSSSDAAHMLLVWLNILYLKQKSEPFNQTFMQESSINFRLFMLIHNKCCSVLSCALCRIQSFKCISKLYCHIKIYHPNFNVLQYC